MSPVRALIAPPAMAAAAVVRGKKHRKKAPSKKKGLYVDFAESEALPYTAPEVHHHISHSLWDDPNVFSFLNPDKAIRGTGMLIGPSLALDFEEYDDNEEWHYHYVNIFVDRDMYVCYVGCGIGHYRVEILEELAEEDQLQQEDLFSRGMDDLEDAATPEQPTQDPDTQGNDPESRQEDVVAGGRDADGTDNEEDEWDSTYESGRRVMMKGGGGGSSSESEDEELGPEDREGSVDDVQEEGYAPL
ncbi:C2H2-type domain-containing protein [Mycena venus]|uniref:C2H2-type domain-containing protein n=1 Tax=Mycena venus TaxID=2733690 RepID=A0A8H6X2K0_9AGAR|nr:C2H2-type domain-containing protein [Mycena venus]